ncbi:conserved exported hypothetical protein [Candidatus Sulfobium mesophilum]|uniref:Carboxypeptidase regulatory-like domain-containing protein n=1 Tax=Candidatus Sulfobium mesophilum TaxID=2016548 RepID=A0A2U3QEQ2_9BACT|nr:conserved exported hypothetical protein [Candidatus Sulfobium mesophilum]
MKRLTFLTACLFLLAAVVASSQEVGRGKITGQLMTEDGTPMSGGSVFFFNDATGPPPSQEKYWRVPDAAAPIGEGGRFSMELPAGKYYLGAMKKISSEKNIGPPEEGDYFLKGQGSKGKPKTYIVKKGETTDIGTIAEAVPFKRAVVKYGDGITSIEGVVRDPDGKPVEGAAVFGYKKPAARGKPLFASDKTGKDGKYVLRVDEGGKYYLKGRDLFGGGPPVGGAIVGRYWQERPVEVSAKTGVRTKGIDINVRLAEKVPQNE